MGDAQYQTCFAGFRNIKFKKYIISATLGGAGVQVALDMV